MTIFTRLFAWVLRLIPLCMIFKSAVCEQAQQDSAVATLTKSNFEDTIAKEPFILVEFFAPWCGHCKALEPEFNAAAVAMKGKVPLAKVDATMESALAEKYKVEGYPTIYFFRNGRHESYGGGRTKDEIVAWLESNIEDALKEVSTEEIEKRIKGLSTAKGFKRTLWVAKGSTDLKNTFAKLADENRPLGEFLYVEDSEKSLGVHFSNGESAAFEGDHSSADDILNFMKSNVVPAFGEIDEDNYEAYLTVATKGMFWACFPSDTYKVDAQKYGPAFREVRKKWTSYPFSYLNTAEYEEHAKTELGCQEGKTTLILQQGNLSEEEEPEKRKLFQKVLGDSEVIDADMLDQFLKDVHAGNVKVWEAPDDLDDDEPDDLDDEAEL